MATYLAVTTEHAEMLGWSIYAVAGNPAKALRLAEDAVAAEGPATDIHVDTRRKNLRVWSLTQARRLLGRGTLDEMFYAFASTNPSSVP